MHTLKMPTRGRELLDQGNSESTGGQKAMLPSFKQYKLAMFYVATKYFGKMEMAPGSSS